MKLTADGLRCVNRRLSEVTTSRVSINAVKSRPTEDR